MLAAYVACRSLACLVAAAWLVARRRAAGFREVAWPALLIMALVAAMVVPLLWLGR
jgi:hypothetical protein